MIQKELAALFRRLGARDPEGWARSQLQEEIPQLARFLFLRQAWRTIIGEEDATWIDANIARAEREPNEPFAGVGLALKKLRARGAADDEIIDLVRGMQAELLFSLCYLLEDPGDLEPEIAGVSWILAQIDEEGNVIGSISSLHESVLETDPTGREMRPRRSAGQRSAKGTCHINAKSAAKHTPDCLTSGTTGPIRTSACQSWSERFESAVRGYVCD